ncbi:GNAT family N-acetyltransferase [Bacillus sp. FJAT-45350]|uniref:GNAT family N-acetyltransferase n=1 Tax=Bacillus sp. FJAT-45350 TaxID=2011014 RepID=UPI000BB9B838|nr:GNAT family protein [Bacillus sp. FJAT-45350]
MFDKPSSIQFETKNLIVRNIEIIDKYHIYNLYSDPGVIRFDNSDGLKSVEEAEQFIRQITNPYVNTDSIRWAIIHKESGEFIGTCGFRNWDRVSDHAEIGGNILSGHWGKKYATELLPSIVDYGFRVLQLNKVHAYTIRKNKPVLKLLKKYNFKIEGYLREYQLIKGKYEDVVVYGILKSEWKK